MAEACVVECDDVSEAQRDKDRGRSRFLSAVYRDQKHIFRELFSPGDVDNIGNTALHLAQSADAVMFLLESGISVNVRNYNGQTALCSAVRRFNPAVVEILLEKGADPNLEDFDGLSPLYWFGLDKNEKLTENQWAVFRLLVCNNAKLMSGCDIRNAAVKPLLFDNSCQDAEALLEYIEKRGYDYEQVGDGGHTMLHVLAMYKNIKIPKEQTPQGGGIHDLQILGWLLRDDKCYDLIQKILPKFLANSCQVNSQTLDTGDTPLHVAVIYSNAEIIPTLIVEGADVNKCNFLGRTALVLCLVNSYEKMIRSDSECSGVLECIKTLLDHGANVGIADIFGRNAIFYACFLIHSQQQIDSKQLSVFIEVLQILLDAATESSSVTNQVDRNGCSLLHLTTMCEESIFKNFLSNCGDVDSKDIFNATPLHYAAAGDSTSIARLLISKGADKSARDKLHRTPRDIAHMLGNCLVSRELDGETVAQRDCLSVQIQNLQNECLVLESDSNCLEKLPEMLWNSCARPRPHMEFLHHLINSPRFVARKSCGNIETSSELQHEVNMIEHAVKTFTSELAWRISESDPQLKLSVLLRGSMREGTKCGLPDEFDFVLVLDEFSEMCEISEYIQDYLGAVILENKYHSEIGLQNEKRRYFDSGGILNVVRLSKAVRDAVTRVASKCTIWESQIKLSLLGMNDAMGSASFPITLLWQGEVCKSLLINIDLVPAIRLQNVWPLTATGERKLYPFNYQSFGCLALPLKGHSARRYALRLSLTDLENEILSSQSSEAKAGYVLTKALLTTCPSFVAPTCENPTRFKPIADRQTSQSLITSYMLKTSFLFVIEDLRRKTTIDDSDLRVSEDFHASVICWARKIVTKLHSFLSTGCLPSFFFPECQISPSNEAAWKRLVLSMVDDTRADWDAESDAANDDDDNDDDAAAGDDDDKNDNDDDKAAGDDDGGDDDAGNDAAGADYEPNATVGKLDGDDDPETQLSALTDDTFAQLFLKLLDAGKEEQQRFPVKETFVKEVTDYVELVIKQVHSKYAKVPDSFLDAILYNKAFTERAGDSIEDMNSPSDWVSYENLPEDLRELVFEADEQVKMNELKLHARLMAATILRAMLELEDENVPDVLYERDVPDVLYKRDCD